jgi:hypothetical protein
MPGAEHKAPLTVAAAIVDARVQTGLDLDDTLSLASCKREERQMCGESE